MSVMVSKKGFGVSLVSEARGHFYKKLLMSEGRGNGQVVQEYGCRVMAVRRKITHNLYL